jgi:hypothetical protein
VAEHKRNLSTTCSFNLEKVLREQPMGRVAVSWGSQASLTCLTRSNRIQQQGKERPLMEKEYQEEKLGFRWWEPTWNQDVSSKVPGDLLHDLPSWRKVPAGRHITHG